VPRAPGDDAPDSIAFDSDRGGSFEASEQLDLSDEFVEGVVTAIGEGASDSWRKSTELVTAYDDGSFQMPQAEITELASALQNLAARPLVTDPQEDSGARLEQVRNAMHELTARWS
jgi:hypothetical protein